jgi:hypothetical protein
MTSDTAYAIRNRLLRRLKVAVQSAKVKKAAGTMQLVGCDLATLRGHIDNQLGGRSLDHYQLDHIFPFVRYNLQLASQQRRVMHYTNLQPLSTSENTSKNDRLPTKAMAAKVDRCCWPDGVTEDMLPTIYPGWSSPLRM